MESDKINLKKFKYVCLGAGLGVILLLIFKFAFPSPVVDIPPMESYVNEASINWDTLRKPLLVDLPTLDIGLAVFPETTTTGAFVSLTAEVKGVSQGPFIYHFDCNDDGVFELETQTVFQKIYIAQNICLFSEEGNFNPKVIVDGFFDYFQNGQEVKEKKTAQASSAIKITNSNLPPVFSSCDVDNIEGTTQINFKFNFIADAKDPNGDEIKYEWDFGDGNKAQGQNVEYNYKTAGPYVPKVKATDSNGAVAFCVVKSLTILKGLSSSYTIEYFPRAGRQNPFSLVKPGEVLPVTTTTQATTTDY